MLASKEILKVKFGFVLFVSTITSDCCYLLICREGEASIDGRITGAVSLGDLEQN